MNLKDIIEAVSKHATGYGTHFLSILSNPSELSEHRMLPEHTRGISLSLFLIFSVFIGATIGMLIPNRPPIADRAIIAIVVMVLWAFLSLIVHSVCKLLRGKGSAMITFSAMTQILAVAYVISNFGTLLFVAFRKAYPAFDHFVSHTSLDTPGVVLFAIQFTFLLAYIPLTISAAHKFKGFQRVVAALIGAGCAVLFGFPIFSMGGC